MKIKIIGTGYVGLVSGVCFASKGNHVTCYDINKDIILKLHSGKMHFYEPGVESVLKSTTKNDLFHVKHLEELNISKNDVVFIAVGTPTKNNDIDFKFIKEASEKIGKEIAKCDGFTSVVLKSTVIPGTTDTLVKEIIEKNSSKKHGEFGLGMNPEFLREGNALDDFLTPDRIILGHDDQKTLEQLEEIYSPWNCDKIKVNTRTAEMTKYACNSLLAIQISSTNELANICSSIGGIDITDVMQGVHTDKFWNPILESSKRANPEILSYLKPGCGFGGSCFPKDLKAIRNHSEKLGLNPHILNAVLKVNDNQPYQVINLLKQSFRSIKDKKLLILGLSFKPNTDDVRESVSIKIINELVLANAKIIAHDPVAIQNAKKHFNLNTKVDFSEDWQSKLSIVDAVLILTNWDEYKQLSNSSNQPKLKNKIIIDSRRLFNPTDFPDAKYQTVGRNI